MTLTRRRETTFADGDGAGNGKAEPEHYANTKAHAGSGLWEGKRGLSGCVGAERGPCKHKYFGGDIIVCANKIELRTPSLEYVEYARCHRPKIHRYFEKLPFPKYRGIARIP